ncbi:MAG TPA: type II toxin-antitoxin system VapC family toxin [Burkholderiaceae bacterium]|nr:type II toxin-antitoxin system VapC family toxin [Burkholderiaceae bacterium]
MASLDTNVLVRWLIKDDERQLAVVQTVFEAAAHREEPLFVPLTVVLELEWVLRSRYGFGKTAILAVFNALLETREIEFHEEGAVERAIHAYRLGRAEFTDCLHMGISGAFERTPLLTFDVAAARLPGVDLISAS